MDRWSIWVDIEGFSSIDLNRGVFLLRELAFDLYRIGSGYLDEEGIFIHQFGDGFVVSPYQPEGSFYRPFSLAVALLQSTTIRGGTARVTISSGEMADVTGCLHTEMRDLHERGHITLGTGPGQMTINPVLGEGLINAYHLSGQKPRGPQLLLTGKPEGVGSDAHLVVVEQYEHYTAVDWIRSVTPLAKKFLDHLCQREPTERELCDKLRQYIDQEKSLNEAWKVGARRLLSLS